MPSESVREGMGTGTLVVWGAGKIGRGFAADLFAAAGWQLVLVDQSADLIEALRAAGRYTVVRVPGADRREEAIISGYRALTTAQTAKVAAALVTADLVSLAVFPQVFDAVARQLVPGLLHRRRERPQAPLDLLLLTNVAHAGPRFRAALQAALPLKGRSAMEDYVGVVETLVMRMAVEPPTEALAREPLLVMNNGYPELPVERAAFRGRLPVVAGLRPVEDMRAEETRKLYTYNTFHAALGYLGALRGYGLMRECLADPAVRALAQGTLAEAAAAVGAAYGFSDAAMADWQATVIAQTDNPALGDTVRRMAADPARKLRREDRLIGPARLALQQGRLPDNLARAAAAALRYTDPDDPGAVYVQERIAAAGLEEAIRTLCDLGPQEEELLGAIAAHYRAIWENPTAEIL